MIELNKENDELEQLYILMSSDKYSNVRVSEFREIIMSVIIRGDWEIIDEEWGKVRELNLTDSEQKKCLDEINERLKNKTMRDLDLEKTVNRIREEKNIKKQLDTF